MKRKKYALATLFFGNRTSYKTMAKVLFDSAMRHGLFAHAEPVLLSPEPVDPAEFARWDVRVIKLPKRDYPLRRNGAPAGLYYKFDAFNLLEYEKVLFSDADAYVHDHDPLMFQLPTPTFLIERHAPMAGGNFLIKPDKGVYGDVTRLALEAQFDLTTGWEHCGAAPAWPRWHRGLFWQTYCETIAPSIRENTWNFACSGTDQGLLYYYYNYCRPGYLCYHFPAFRHLAGNNRAEVLLADSALPYWAACDKAGLLDEMRAEFTADLELRYGDHSKPPDHAVG